MPNQIWASADQIRVKRGWTPDRQSKELPSILILVLGHLGAYRIVGLCTESKLAQLSGVSHVRQRKHEMWRTNFKHHDTNIGHNPRTRDGAQWNSTLLHAGPCSCDRRHFYVNQGVKTATREVKRNYVPTVVNKSRWIIAIAGAAQTFNNPLSRYNRYSLRIITHNSRNDQERKNPPAALPYSPRSHCKDD